MNPRSEVQVRIITLEVLYFVVFEVKKSQLKCYKCDVILECYLMKVQRLTPAAVVFRKQS